MRCPAAVVLWLSALALSGGCGTTRMTNTARTGTEQLLISNAIDQAVSHIDLRCLSGKTVYLDPQYLGDTVDKGYLISSLRQHLLANGCVLQEDRAKANYIVEVRSGGIGTDQHSLLIGIPQMTLPAVVPAQPTQIPEIPFAKKSDQQGVAKIAVFVFNRQTGRPVYQSGVVQAISTLNDTWVLGAGPFRSGTLHEGTEFAGKQLPELPLPPFPLLGEKDNEQKEKPPVVPVTRAVTWAEPPPPQTNVNWFIELVAGPKWTERLRRMDPFGLDTTYPVPISPPPTPQAFPLLEDKNGQTQARNEPERRGFFKSLFKWW